MSRVLGCSTPRTGHPATPGGALAPATRVSASRTSAQRSPSEGHLLQTNRRERDQTAPGRALTRAMRRILHSMCRVQATRSSINPLLPPQAAWDLEKKSQVGGTVAPA